MYISGFIKQSNAKWQGDIHFRSNMIEDHLETRKKCCIVQIQDTQTIFSFPGVLSCQHQLKAKLGMHFAWAFFAFSKEVKNSESF